MDIQGTKKWCYYNQCGCNETDAVSRRHVRPVVVNPNDEVYAIAKQVCTSLALRYRNTHGYSRWTHKQVMDNTSLNKKARYNRAYRNLKEGNYNWSTFSNGQAFIKFEKMPQQKADDGAPGRLIQYRSFEYTYLLKSFLGPLWEGLKHSDMVINDYTGQRFKEVFTSSMNYKQVGTLVSTLWSRHEDCVGICVDHSFFDGHHHSLNLDLEHHFWNTVVDSRYFRRLLRLQRVNNIRCKISRSKYRSVATRLSGDWNTSAGNSIINYLMLRTIFPTASIVVNGDDSIIFIARRDLIKLCGRATLESITEWTKKQFARFGQTTKVDRVAGIIEQIEYCQCSPVWFPDGYRMVRTPMRCLSRVQYTSHYNMDAKTYYTSVGLCELASNPGVPIMQQFALNLIQRGSGRIAATILTDGLHYMSDEDLDLKVYPVDERTRQSFYLAFGYTREQQLRLESELSAVNVMYNKRVWDRMSIKIAASNRLQRR